ncbi:MAG: threonylcarbamoyl-AMP synthase, partial [Candidatus Methanomethylicota archaeon]
DTVYGLGCNPFDEAAIKKIFEVKKRDLGKPIPLLVSDFKVVEKLAYVNEAARKAMEAFWPGALTILVKVRRNVVPKLITAGSDKVGLRIPNCKATIKLIQAIGGVITGTSANISGEDAPSTVDPIIKQLGEKVDLILDAGKTPISIPSTVVDLSEEPFKIVREGAISREVLVKKLNIKVV